MYTYSTIACDSDAVHISAGLDKNMNYVDPHLTFYEVSEEGWRSTGCKMINCFDDPKFILNDIYLKLIEAKNKNIEIGLLDHDLGKLMESSNISVEELIDIIEHAAKLNFFGNIKPVSSS